MSKNDKSQETPEDFSPILMDEQGNPVHKQKAIDVEKLAAVIAGVSHCSAGGEVDPQKLAAVIAGVSHCSAGGEVDPQKLAAVIATPATPELAREIVQTARILAETLRNISESLLRSKR